MKRTKLSEDGQARILNGGKRKKSSPTWVGSGFLSKVLPRPSIPAVFTVQSRQSINTTSDVTMDILPLVSKSEDPENAMPLIRPTLTNPKGLYFCNGLLKPALRISSASQLLQPSRARLKQIWTNSRTYMDYTIIDLSAQPTLGGCLCTLQTEIEHCNSYYGHLPHNRKGISYQHKQRDQNRWANASTIA
jgi:hypothetical protein